MLLVARASELGHGWMMNLSGRQQKQMWTVSGCCSRLIEFNGYFEMIANGKTQGCGLGLDVSVPSRGRDGLDMHQRLVSVSPICVSCPRRYFAQLLQAILIKWAKSAVAIMAVLTRMGNRSMYYSMTEVSGWWSDVIVLTCSLAIASKINLNV